MKLLYRANHYPWTQEQQLASLSRSLGQPLHTVLSNRADHYPEHRIDRAAAQCTQQHSRSPWTQGQLITTPQTGATDHYPADESNWSLPWTVNTRAAESIITLHTRATDHYPAHESNRVNHYLAHRSNKTYHYPAVPAHRSSITYPYPLHSTQEQQNLSPSLPNTQEQPITTLHTEATEPITTLHTGATDH